MAIKITAGGKIITKGGLPSCTCCGPCSPDVTTVYVEYVDDPLGTPSVGYFEMTGSLNAEEFTGGVSGTATLRTETPGSDQWIFDDPSYGQAYGLGTFRCDPQGEYSDADGVENEYSVTVSFTPLP